MKKTWLFLSVLCIGACTDVTPAENSWKSDKPIVAPGVALPDTITDTITDAAFDSSSDGQSDALPQPDSTSDLPLPPPDAATDAATDKIFWKSCAAAGFNCGSAIDATGRKHECGSCERGLICENNQCINPCDPDPCADTEATCTVSGGGYYCRCEPGYKLSETGECVLLDTVTLRIMSANITSTSKQSYAGPGIRIFMGLKPDIVLIQEFRYLAELDKEYSFKDIDDFVAGVFGEEFTYHRGAMKLSGDIPNGIISRYPIKESGTWRDNQVDNRHFEWARIDIPGDKDLWAISVHFLTKTSKQPAEADALVDYITANVPDNDYIVIGGDFNTTSRDALCLKTLNNVVVVKESDYPEDQDGNEGTNIKRSKPYDGVYVDSYLHQKETAVVIGEESFDDGLVFDSRTFNSLKDVSPVKAKDSTAGQMQHMPVIRDFKLW